MYFILNISLSTFVVRDSEYFFFVIFWLSQERARFQNFSTWHLKKMCTDFNLPRHEKDFQSLNRNPNIIHFSKVGIFCETLITRSERRARNSRWLLISKMKKTIFKAPPYPCEELLAEGFRGFAVEFFKFSGLRAAEFSFV